MIAIVDHGSGNVGAIQNVYHRLRVESSVVRNREDLLRAQKIILPGVGSFDAAMRSLNESGMTDALCELVLERGVPVLGICVGMQLLGRGSEEGGLPGLGWINGSVEKLRPRDTERALSLPHMGWNAIELSGEPSIFAGVDLERGFYFLHSYAIRCDDKTDVLAVTHYSGPIVAAVRRNGIFGVQFHPEKSHQNGTTLLRNFADL